MDNAAIYALPYVSRFWLVFLRFKILIISIENGIFSAGNLLALPIKL